MEMRRIAYHTRLFTARLEKEANALVKSIAMGSIVLLLAVLACGPASPTPDTSIQPPGDQSPTVTPTLPPTESPWIEGSVVRAPYDPAAGLGPPDVHDDFSGTNPEFELDNVSGVARSWYQNGRFNITFPTRGWWTWYSGSTGVRNFYVDIVVYNSDQCVERDAAGLLYRLDQNFDRGFLFGVTCGGGYFSGFSYYPGATGPVCIFLNSAPDDLDDLDCSGLWSHPVSEYIDPGPGAANRIGIRAMGTQISLYINGHQVDNLQGIFPMFMEGTDLALYLGAGQADNASVSFDDFSIWFNP
jgi:hypothetical protein